MLSFGLSADDDKRLKKRMKSRQVIWKNNEYMKVASEK